MANGYTAANIFATLLAGAAFFYIGWRIGRYKLREETALLAFSHELIWTLAGAGLVAISLRETAALLGYAAVNKALFYGAGFFLASISAPITFQVAYLFTRNKRNSLISAGVMLLFSWLAPVTLLMQDVSVVATAYGTEFTTATYLPQSLFITFTVIPVVVFCVYLIGIGSGVERQPARQHTLLMPIGLLFLVFLLVLDLVPLTGPAQLVLRSLYLVDAAWLYATYFNFSTVDTYHRR